MKYNQSIKGKLFQYFEARLDIKKSTKGFWRCDCPYCFGHFCFGINFEGYRSHCFRCPEKPNLIQLLMFLESFQTYAEAYRFLSVQKEYEYYERIPNEVVQIERKTELPEGYKLITQGDNIISKCARNYMKKRGFSIKKLAEAGVGFCDSGLYDGYIIFPFYRKGELIYYQGRLFMGSGTKMKNPSEQEFFIGKSQTIYNEDALFIYNKIFVVESITNALTIGDNAIALAGKVSSKWQSANILKSPCNRVIIALDPDAMEEAYCMGMQLVHTKRVKIIKLPKDKDVNDIGREKTIELEKEADYLNYMQIYKLKLNEGS